MKLNYLIAALCWVIFFGSCASSYKPINPQFVPYSLRTTDKGLHFDFKYNMLQARYAKKESKKGIRLIAVRMKNNTGRDLVFGKDITLGYSFDKSVQLIDNRLAYRKLKQGSIGYLLYLGLAPFNIVNSNNQGKNTMTPAGLIIGPGLAIINITAAHNANRKFKNDLLKYDLMGTTIKNGEITYGIIAIKSDNYDPLVVKVNDIQTTGSN